MDYTLKKKSDLIKLCKEHNINNLENKSKNELIELLEKNNSEEYLDLNDIINKVIESIIEAITIAIGVFKFFIFYNIAIDL